ncbi:hypothetical protein [Clostridium sp. D46t1_190503_E9]|uniref:hypothetical protein n=1 Tax=Clostridium sp. D46t1_190503_E9 TaxID=2787137 RepID=UPI001896C944|nr:hypothetical protein [Clostridium sp. D46t1_190503_E9]
MEIFLILFLIALVIYNTVYSIPNKLNRYEEKMLLHFKELNLKINRLEKMISDNNNN